MTYVEKIAWLQRYQTSLKQEKELTEEVEQLRARACSCSLAFTGMPSTQGDGQALPRVVEKILQAQLELQQQIEKCTAVRNEIVIKIEQIHNPRDKEILRRKYILGQQFEKIAAALDLEYRWVRRLHHKVVTNMKIEI